MAGPVVARRDPNDGGGVDTGTERKQDRVTIKDADDLYTNVPLGAAKLEAKLAKSGELNVAMTIVGRFEAYKVKPKPEELEGADCSRATHVISALTVGAFDFFAGAAAELGGGATALGASAGGKSASKRETLNRDGEEASCAKASRKDAEPPEGCGAFLRVEVVPLGAAAAPACPDGSKWNGKQCVRTEVVTEVKCPAGTHRVGDGCAADVSTQCASGLRFVDGQGCMPNLVAAAPSAPPSSATPAIDRAPLAPDEAAIRKSLEPKVWSGKGSRADITMLKVICMHMGDRPCRDRADAMLKAKAEGE